MTNLFKTVVAGVVVAGMWVVVQIIGVLEALSDDDLWEA